MLAKTLLDRHYGTTAELAHALADVLAEQVRHLDADVVQIDEANLPGHPEEWEWAAAAMNRVLDAVPSTPAVHLCFGNYGGQSVQKGSWRQLMRYLNALHADHVVLECAHRPPEELAVFKDLRPEIGFGLGVVDIKATEVESADAVARAIERAEALLGAGRVKYIHPDCGFWMLKRSIADAKIRALAKGRDLFEGRQSGRRVAAASRRLEAVAQRLRAVAEDAEVAADGDELRPHLQIAACVGLDRREDAERLAHRLDGGEEPRRSPACTSGWLALPRWPSAAAARSDGPTNTPSTPSTEAISVAACRPFRLSICTSTQICSSMPAK